MGRIREVKLLEALHTVKIQRAQVAPGGLSVKLSRRAHAVAKEVIRAVDPRVFLDTALANRWQTFVGGDARKLGELI